MEAVQLPADAPVAAAAPAPASAVSAAGTSAAAPADSLPPPATPAMQSEEDIVAATPPAPITASSPGEPSEPQNSPSAFREGREILPALDALSHSDPDKVEGPSKKRYISTTCLLFRPAALPRRLCIYFIESRFFEPVILFTILANCATMALESPMDPPGTAKAAFINVRNSCRACSPAVLPTHAPCSAHPV